MSQDNMPALPVTLDDVMNAACRMMRDSWATGDDAAWQPGYEACARISETAEESACCDMQYADKGDYIAAAIRARSGAQDEGRTG